nr:SGNH/GDSL hydrolase family protein [Comamonas testosteroni]
MQQSATHGLKSRRNWLGALGLLALGLSGCGGGGGGGDGGDPVPPPVAKVWLTTWAAAPTGPASLTASAPFVPAITLQNQTVRMIVRGTVAGHKVRIRLSNEVGDAPVPVRIGAASIGLRDKGHAVVASTSKALTFDGKKEVTIAAKSVVYSDPVDLDVPALKDLAISLYLPDKVTLQSAHFVTRQMNYLSPGNETASASLPNTAAPTPYWYVATGVDVQTVKPMALVAFGDSITDGFGEASLRNDAPTPWPSWPSRLADRLSAASGLAGLSVLNAGISGNRVLSDAPNLGPTAEAVRALGSYGSKGLDRFQRDVLEQRGASCVVILEGINDIGIGSLEGKPVTSEQLITAYKQLIAKAKAGGLKVIGATLLPFAGYSAPYYSDSNNATREAVNQWIRTGGAYDGVIDFDAALRDATNPKQLQPQYDSGDHLHPNDAGYKAMADSVDLGMLQKLCIKP